MALVEIARGGTVAIPTEIKKKYRIRSGIQVTVTDENGVITIRPQLQEAVRLAKRNLKTGG
jgi:bifunctional DNA-binding transcriptional regulator/antitoxin component of YhaV-PrlF toxin-antitoxin module